MAQAELARQLGLGKVATGSMIDRLEAAGLVVRQADTLDRRINRIFVTPKGQAILEDMVEVGRRLNGLVLAGLSPGQLEVADQVLTTIKRNLRRALRDDGDEQGLDGPAASDGAAG
jgi:DNA-binding MarR family transcriptional regulator